MTLALTIDSILSLIDVSVLFKALSDAKSGEQVVVWAAYLLSVLAASEQVRVKLIEQVCYNTHYFFTKITSDATATQSS